jgi:hypothetical protein
LATRQALDHLSRPEVRKEKGGARRRDRLIRLAAAKDGWVVGFEDETW